jgi:CDP-diacylglycerol--serine O-phosphatidyltransferase
LKKKLFIAKLTIVDMITLCALFSAVTSIYVVLRGFFAFSLSLMFLSMLFDAMDGMVARKLNILRDFGRYFDGFMDAINYLLAPAIFLYLWGFNSWYYLLILFLFILSGIVRLSVFNEIGNVKRDDNKLAYWGMPVFWSLFYVGGVFILSAFIEKHIVLWITAGILLIVSFLMVHNSDYYKFKSWKVLFVLCTACSLFFALIGFNVIRIFK